VSQHEAMKGVLKYGVTLHVFLVSALNGGELSLYNHFISIPTARLGNRVILIVPVNNFPTPLPRIESQMSSPYAIILLNKA
jgi:hypothetical protein